jgi:hypothetical protein
MFRTGNLTDKIHSVESFQERDSRQIGQGTSWLCGIQSLITVSLLLYLIKLSSYIHYCIRKVLQGTLSRAIQVDSVRVFTSCFSKLHLILFFHLRLDLRSNTFSQSFAINNLYAFLSFLFLLG